jgi:hypothetical protein
MNTDDFMDSKCVSSLAGVRKEYKTNVQDVDSALGDNSPHVTHL